MKELKYSAGNVSKGFWFNEFKKYNELLKEGKTDKEIRNLQKEENILLAPSESYGIKAVGEVSRRAGALPDRIRNIFLQTNFEDQKIINLLGIMMTDRLFFEYTYEVYRKRLILGDEVFEDSNARVFFKNKSDQSEKVAGFTDQTKKRLAGAYKTFLRESNLLVKKDKDWVYNTPILGLKLEEAMKTESLYPYLKAITGEAHE